MALSGEQSVEGLDSGCGSAPGVERVEAQMVVATNLLLPLR